MTGHSFSLLSHFYSVLNLSPRTMPLLSQMSLHSSANLTQITPHRQARGQPNLDSPLQVGQRLAFHVTLDTVKLTINASQHIPNKIQNRTPEKRSLNKQTNKQKVQTSHFVTIVFQGLTRHNLDSEDSFTSQPSSSPRNRARKTRCIPIMQPIHQNTVKIMAEIFST